MKFIRLLLLSVVKLYITGSVFACECFESKELVFLEWFESWKKFWEMYKILDKHKYFIEWLKSRKIGISTIENIGRII